MKNPGIASAVPGFFQNYLLCRRLFLDQSVAFDTVVGHYRDDIMS